MMATLEGRELLDPRYFAGAAYELSAPAEDPLDLELPSGSRAQLHKGSPYIVAHVGRTMAPRIDLVLARTGEAAQELLDIYSVRCGVDRSILSMYDNQITWWKRRQQRTLLITTSFSNRVRMLVSAQVVDADGTIQPPPPIDASVIPAFRYFRYSRITNNVIDAYRNMYLAFESLLTENFGGRRYDPAKRKTEGVTEWIERAVRQLDLIIPLQQYTKQGASDPAGAFLKDQYSALRCSLFHAKMGKNQMLPGDPSQRDMVRSALTQLSRLVMAMFDHFFSLRRASSGMSLYAIRQFVQSLVTNGLALGLSEDCAAFDLNRTTASPQALPVVDMATTYAGDADGMGFEHVFEGSIDAGQVATFPIRCLVVHIANKSYFLAALPNLVATGFDKVTARVVWRIQNHGEMREDYLL